MAPDIDALASRLVDETAAMMPVVATYIGVPGHDHRWNDYTTDGAEREQAMFADQLRRIRELPASDDAWSEISRRVIEAALEDSLEWYEHGEHFLDLNSMASSFQDLRDTFDQMPRETRGDWAIVADRLAGLPLALDGYGTRLEDGRRRGMTVARRQVFEAARQGRNHAGDGSFFLDLLEEYGRSDIGDRALATRLEQSVAEVRAAYAGLVDYLEGTYAPDARTDDAVGEERYVRLAGRFLGTELDARAVYDWGWSEVERLRRRMETVAEQIAPGSSMADALEVLATDPARAAASPEEFRQLMCERQAEALSELDGIHFDVPEQIRSIDVKLTPPGGAVGVYYVGPSEDHTRTGTVWWSLGDKQIVPLFDQISTAYHEGFPGHHLQGGIQMAGADRLTRYQKLMVWYPGTGEGWALYAEDLMEEFGYLEKPDYVMGKLASEMLRAARVVIDIGSHLQLPIPGHQPFHPGEPWTFETGVDMLRRYAGQDAVGAAAEMNRYLGWPGQAISYKLGQQAIRDLRSEAQTRHGADFDLKVFNARVLEIGSVGIDVLRDHLAAH